MQIKALTPHREVGDSNNSEEFEEFLGFESMDRHNFCRHIDPNFIPDASVIEKMNDLSLEDKVSLVFKTMCARGKVNVVTSSFSILRVKFHLVLLKFDCFVSFN